MGDPVQPCFDRLATPPDLLDLHRGAAERWPYLLASCAGARGLGRWSILLHGTDEQLILDADGLRGPGRGKKFLDRLEDWSGPPVAGDWHPDFPFQGGWFIYLGYELAAEIEPKLDLPGAKDGLPVAVAARCPAAVLVDHLEGDAWLVAESVSALERARAELVSDRRPRRGWQQPELDLKPDEGRRFLQGVERIKDWILDGDVFQVNLSRGWHGVSRRPLDPASCYRALSRANPAPFAGLARLPGGTVLSSSPERLVRVRGRSAEMRPIAGTRPRGRTGRHDESLSRELMAHPKERAEHIMLIDLGRNDLGRVCENGSVEVDELMVVESYAHVHHIVSNLRGHLRPSIHAAAVIAAVFPGGTITGCPKVRCMEIICELERQGRGFYTGSMGYLGRNGAMDLNILIRSMVVNDRRLSFRTGAGIVADSDPRAELAETESKARGLLEALGA